MCNDNAKKKSQKHHHFSIHLEMLVIIQFNTWGGGGVGRWGVVREEIPSIRGQGRQQEELPHVEVRGGGQEEIPQDLKPEARGSGRKELPHA